MAEGHGNPGPAGDSTASFLDRDGGGDEPDALPVVLQIVYERLRRLAAKHMQGQPADHTFQATALANEAVIRLLRGPPRRWTDRAHVLATAGRVMRQVLIDHARRKGAVKRGGGVERDALDAVVLAFEERSGDLASVDEALARLARMNEGAARLVECRFFLGLTMDEAARELGMSKRAAEREWSAARAWLAKELAE